MMNNIMKLNDVNGNKMTKIFKHIGIYPFAFKFLGYDVNEVYDDVDELKLSGFTLSRDDSTYFDPITIMNSDELVFHTINTDKFKMYIGTKVSKIIKDRDALMYKYLQDIYRTIANINDNELVYIAVEYMNNSTSGVKKCIIIRRDFYYILYLTNNNSIIDIHLHQTVASPFIALFQNKDNMEEVIKEYDLIK